VTPVTSPEPTPARPTRRLPIALLAAGLLIVAFGLFVQAPMGAGAVWNGVLDSAQATPSAVPGVLGSSSPTMTVALFFRNAPGSRTLRMPPAFAALATSFHPGDTLRVTLGWGRRQETAMALGILQNGAVVLDSAVVLRAQRERSNRTAAAGLVLGLLGLIGLVRRRSSAVAPASAGPV
jgi:hypothetical protein